MSTSSVNLRAGLAWPLVAALTACAPPRTAPAAQPGDWRGLLGGAARSAYSGESVGGPLEPAWRKGYGRGITASPHVHAPLLVATTTGRTVVTIDAAGGMQYWARGFSGPIAGSVLRRDDRLYVATGDRENRVHAITLARGRRIWSSRRIGTIRVEPVLLDDRLVAVTEAGIAFSLAETDGAVLWSTRLGAGPAVPPIPHGGDVWVATVRDSLYRIRASDGQVTKRIALSGTPSAPGLLRGERLTLPVFPNHVVTVDVGRGTVSDRVALSAPVLAAPLPGDGGVSVLLTRSGDLLTLGAGADLRTVVRLGGSVTTSFARIGADFAIGRLDGALFLVDSGGRTLWRRDFDDSIVAPVAAHGGALYVPLFRGDIVKLEAR